ncbi:MAG: glyoxylate carboligase [Oscillospiraceae bacterium]|nr:glyoxylate carboligase [Oscillospiraceae bacterium]
MKMTAAEAFVKIITKEGINTAFGIPGAGINPVYKYMGEIKMEHYTMRHEEACVHAADGYQRAKHEIAMAICSCGPAATNFVTGLYTAFIDSMPVFCVVGQANTNQLGQEPFQCVDMPDIVKTVTKKAWCVMTPDELPAIMNEAFYLMREGRPGPVLIEFPLNVQNAELDFDIDAYEPKAIPVVEPEMDKIKEAVKMIGESKAPVIVMGGGCFISDCCDKVVELAETLQIPVITTYQAKGGIPEDHPLNAGHAGIQVGQPIGNKVFLDSDLVIGIGNRFSDRHTGDLKTYCEGRKFIHINIEPSQIGLVFQADLGIVSDAKLATEALLAEVKAAGLEPINPARAAEIPALREQLARKTDYTCSPMMPHRVFQEVNEAFDDETYYTAGCGITQIWGGQLQKINKPCKYLPSGGAGTLGYEVPAAFGVKVAQPDCHSVTVVGDFGLTFMGEEIAVASVYKKPIIVVVVNNAYLGLIRQNQKGAYGFEYAVDMPYNQDGTIDYVKLGEAYGCVAERVFSPEELQAALVRAKASVEASGRCYLIDAICVKTQLCDMGGSIAAIKSWAPQE